MKITGTVQGEAARLYPRFLYRLPIMERLDLRSVDPERLIPTQEYPRDVSRISAGAFKTVDLADYEITVSDTDNSGMRRVELWMLPHKVYTDAKEPKLVYTAVYSQIAWAIPALRDHVLERGFRATKALEGV